MKKIVFSPIVFIPFFAFMFSSCSSDSSGSNTQIIADHTIVSAYSSIPQKWIDEVKKMWVNIPGESHSEAYRAGLTLLAAQDSRFAASATDTGGPEASTAISLRTSRAYRSSSSWVYGTGESTWYTNAAGIQAVKDHITYCETNSLHIAAIGFGWCWDMTWQNSPSGIADPVYGVRWAGSSEGGPEGSKIWGLDSGDTALTGNSVCMDTYLAATEQYIAFCKTNGYTTKVLFTTGPVDGYTGENGYQRQIKHEYMRNYVKADSTRILFDYADILCYDDNGTQNVTTWSGHTYPIITSTNAGDGSVGHIGEAGAIRLAKAQWWMLARIAGWDGK
jgi:hypothetical protein